MGVTRSVRWGPVNTAVGWVERRSARTKVLLGAGAMLLSLVVLKLSIHGNDIFFMAGEVVHGAGIVMLIYKLGRHKSCSGLSLKSQELTAIFLATRVYCNVSLLNGIHSTLDLVTLLPTLWVIYMIRFKLSSTYMKELDSMPRYKLVVPCLVLALFIHPYPYIYGTIIDGFLYAFCVYLEAISVLPQLKLIQNAKMVEPITARYVFALGVARFFNFAHCIFMVIETKGSFVYQYGRGVAWVCALFVAELVQTFILADFCYYYVKCCMFGNLNISIP